MSKKTKLEKTLDFMAGKGFYIILIACVAAIGISGYMLLFRNDTPSIAEDPDNSLINWLEPSVGDSFLETAPSSGTAGDFPEDDGVLSVINPTSIPVSPSIVPEPPSPKPELSPSPSPQAKPSPSSTPKPSSKPASPPQFFWPISGEVITPYARDELIYSKTMGDWRAHVGVDIAAQLGTQVMAAADGTVKDVYTDPKLGSCVLIEHSDGMSSLYSNLQEQATVQIDKKVKAGDVIGGVGNTAMWESGEEAHLHLEVYKDGKSVDPLDWLPEK